MGLTFLKAHKQGLNVRMHGTIDEIAEMLKHYSKGVKEIRIYSGSELEPPSEKEEFYLFTRLEGK